MDNTTILVFVVVAVIALLIIALSGLVSERRSGHVSCALADVLIRSGMFKFIKSALNILSTAVLLVLAVYFAALLFLS